MSVDRRTVDLTEYPDLVVVYLGMRVNALTGMRTLIGLGPQISTSAAAKPAGLLSHEFFLYSLAPPHVGMRQYWRDFASLETWSHSGEHRVWWTNFLRSSGGTGFWHETYRMRGGIEGVYDDMKIPVGMLNFIPAIPARGGMFSSRKRIEATGAADLADLPEAEAVVVEAQL